MRALSLLVGTMLFVTAGNCRAFDVDGYSAGMSIETVRRMVDVQGWRWHANPQTNPNKHLRGFAAYGPNNTFGTFLFCGDSLFSYTKDFGGDLLSFTRLIERETARLGHGVYFVRNGDPEYGPSGSISVEWGMGSDSYSVEFSLFAGREDIGQTWSSRNSCF